MTLPFPRAAGKKLFHGRYSHPPNLPYKKLPSFISLPLLQAVGGVIDASDGLWAFAAMRGALAVFPAKYAAFRSIFGNFIAEKYYFFPVLCYLTGDG